MVYQNKEDDSKVTDELYIKRGCFVLEEFLSLLFTRLLV